ncbi:hypothetical protein JI664_18030 [Rhodobacter sp. NTK016B]|uniref:hypothetical protein n=1 Tax=Rhodobacter sp. NTK016B TaxID=2759676 RepID=UPI001A8CF982|nr:hypothetical protein [Rhodobacter sp. NTK016B]MBN8293875.1 hypothetical protein [Rhodobacter sp. NTK016B]
MVIRITRNQGGNAAKDARFRAESLVLLGFSASKGAFGTRDSHARQQVAKTLPFRHAKREKVVSVPALWSPR